MIKDDLRLFKYILGCRFKPTAAMKDAMAKVLHTFFFGGGGGVYNIFQLLNEGFAFL